MQTLTGEAWLTSEQKRIFDVIFAAGSLPAILPIIGLSATMVALADRHSPFYAQTRIGRASAEFTIFKLRTLLSDEITISDGHAVDPRASAVGRILRILRLDELPQAANILRGDMSVVGPRPLLPVAVEEVMDSLSAGEQTDWLHARRVAKPGWVDPYGAQYYGINGMTYKPRLRAECDITYVHNASMHEDARLLREAARAVGRLARSTYEL